VTRESIRDKTILVVGLARSGCAVGALLRRHGARVIGVDDAPAAELTAAWEAEQLSAVADQAFDEIHPGGDWSFLEERTVNAVALSPGVPTSHPRVAALAAAGLPVLGELEWAARFCPATLIAITGTNGKSTTTELAAHLARVAGWTAEALGNVGRPLSLCADELDPEAVAVVEVSSFQLETIATFCPRVGVVLNLAPDHLDRYENLAAYYAAKRRLAEAIAPGGTFVCWTGCAEARDWPTPGRTTLFGAREEGAEVFLADGNLWVPGAGQPEPLIAVEELSLRSAPNLLNAAAAVAALLPLQPGPERLAAGLRSFTGLPHRQQIVGRLGEVRFVDDSKATNVAAVCAGLAGFAQGVVLIAGGRGKGEDYRLLREGIDPVRAVIVIGEEGPAIAAALAGVVPVHQADSLAGAVAEAARLAAPAGTVLLSPACASFDMFRNYRQRGRAFQDAARALGASPGGDE